MFSVSNVTRTLCMAKRKTTPLDDAATDSIFDVLGTTPDEAASSSESSSVPSETARRSLEPLPLRSVLSAAVPPANSKSPARNTKADTAPETPKAPKPTKSIKPPKTPQLEKSIKEEALALFQKGLTIEEVARELMLPPSAVRTGKRFIKTESSRNLAKHELPPMNVKSKNLRSFLKRNNAPAAAQAR